MTHSVKPFVMLAGEGPTIRGPAGGPTTFMARAETTNGTFTALENIVGPKQGPPLHVHIREDEIFYVLEGSLRFKADDMVFDAPAGSFVFIPRGVPHALRNVGEIPARLLVMFTPAGMERFYEEHAKLPPGPVDPEAVQEIADRAWMKVVGPPLSDDDN